MDTNQIDDHPDHDNARWVDCEQCGNLAHAGLTCEQAAELLARRSARDADIATVLETLRGAVHAWRGAADGSAGHPERAAAAGMASAADSLLTTQATATIGAWAVVTSHRDQILAALEDAADDRVERADGYCYDCVQAATRRCEIHETDLERAQEYRSACDELRAALYG